jgi:polyphosphate kinase 2 (PPK2 family)
MSEEEERKYPDRVDLNLRRIKSVTSKKTNEKLMVLEAEDKAGKEYSLWIHRSNLKELLAEIGKVV